MQTINTQRLAKPYGSSLPTVLDMVNILLPFECSMLASMHRLDQLAALRGPFGCLRWAHDYVAFLFNSTLRCSACELSGQASIGWRASRMRPNSFATVSLRCLPLGLRASTYPTFSLTSMPLQFTWPLHSALACGVGAPNADLMPGLCS